MEPRWKEIHPRENVQRGVSKLVSSIKDRSYEQQLKKLDLPTWTYRRTRGDVIEVYKILNIYDNDVAPKLVMKESYTREHAFTLRKYKNVLKR